MPRPQLRDPAAPPRDLGRWVPKGRQLSAPDWRWRHRVVCGLLAAHVPALALVTLLVGHDWPHAGVELLPLVGLLALAALPLPRLDLPRRVRSLSAGAGLLVCSALLVHLYQGTAEAHFHYFVVVAVLALYQDWAVYALTIGFVTLQHVAAAALGSVDDAWLYLHAGNPWAWGALHTAVVVALCAVMVVFWQANEQARAAEDQLRSALFEGSGSLRARLDEADRIRADLIGTVSHEFRTPLTGIRGAALTLLKRGERLDEASRARLLVAVLDQQERLSRLLENMLVAARATDADTDAVCAIDGVAAEVAMLATSARPGSAAVSVFVDPGTTARIDRQALHQVLANLVDNAQQHGSPGAVTIVAGGQDASGVWLTVSNEGSSLDLAAAGRLFEPFTQADGGSTRHAEGIGMGLYVVRRLVEVHGGSLSVRSEDGWVTVEVRLQAGTDLSDVGGVVAAV